MKKGLFCTLLGAILCITTSCDYKEGRKVHWTFGIQGQDSLLIEYPITIYDSQGYPIPSSEKVDFESIIVYGDTLFDGAITTRNGVDFTNVEIHVSRLSYHDEARIAFIHINLRPIDIYNIEDNYNHSINQQAFDSMMYDYGITLPVGREYIIIPLTVNPPTREKGDN